MDTIVVDYVWIDGASDEDPTARLRSKTKVVIASEWDSKIEVPEWNYDGSSTNQAKGDNADVNILPVRKYKTGAISSIAANYIAMCECVDNEGKPLESNYRAKLKALYDKEEISSQDPLIGFEQEYVMYDTKTGKPLGFPSDGMPAPQGPYYCGVGGDVCFGRKLSEDHLMDCLAAGIMIYGTNAEVMPGQWEFQIGLRNALDRATPLRVSDDVWVARYLLKRRAELLGYYISLQCKPIEGDWNGSGMHANFSTAKMRAPQGMDAIREAIVKLSKDPIPHIDAYGHKVRDRLTSLHETCKWDEFKSGIADRTASIRIPASVAEKGYGYLEDRRPGANADPYIVAHKLVETICGGEEE